jgi:glycosyltransferase involved in cell wall biosynthesis
MIATFNERKAQDVLIEAIKLLPEQYYDQIQIDFVGAIDNRFARHLKNIASDFSFVKFKGRIKFDDKNELYRNTDVLICISRDDPFPVVVSEAMSLSIPCIVSCNVGQSKLIQDNFNSFIVSTGNAEELKNKIIYCINNRSNLNKIGKNAREIYLNNASLENFEKEIGKIL